MLHFLLTMIAAWILWKIVRYEIGRRRHAREQFERFRPAAGVTMSKEKYASLSPEKRAEVDQFQRHMESWLNPERAARAAADRRVEEANARIEEQVKSFPWYKRREERKWLRRRIHLGYDI